MSYTPLLIDTTYFVGDINIPFENKDNSEFNQNYIDRYVEEVLERSIGRDMYEEFIDGIYENTTNGVFADPANKVMRDAANIDGKWLRLLNGHTYEVNDENRVYRVRWDGLINSKKQSFLAYYVFTKYAEQNYNQFLSTGNKIGKAENATSVSIRERLVRAYNECEYYIGEYPYKSDYIFNTLYPHDISEDVLILHNPSLINFLFFHYRADYENWVMRFPEVFSVNYFDI